MRHFTVCLLAAAFILTAASGAPELKVDEIRNGTVQKASAEEPVSNVNTAQKAQAESRSVQTVRAEPVKTGAKAGEVDFRLGDLTVRNASGAEDIDEEDGVFVKDTLVTGVESRCEIRLTDGSLIRLNEKTKYVIDRYETNGDDIAFNGYLVSGEAWTNVRKDGNGRKDFNVRSPIAVAAVIGTAYKMNADGSLTEISVLDGQVNVDLEKQKKAELKIEPKKEGSGSLAPRQSLAPKQIPGPYEVTLSEWISIVKGEKISIRNDGKYNKTKTDVNVLMQEWDAFKSGK